MAIKCATCGRADLMQAGLVSHQCLACGNFTNADGSNAPLLLHKDNVPYVATEQALDPPGTDPERRKRPGDVVAEVEKVAEEVAPVMTSAPVEQAVEAAVPEVAPVIAAAETVDKEVEKTGLLHEIEHLIDKVKEL